MASHFGDLPVRRLQGLLDHMLGAAPAAAALGSLDETIALAIPPRGVELPGEMVKAMEARCAAVEARLSAFVEHDLYADIAIATKAVRFAIKCVLRRLIPLSTADESYFGFMEFCSVLTAAQSLRLPEQVP